MRFADLTLDEETREVWRGEQPIELTRTEFELLRFMMLNPRRVLTKRQILDNVWHYDFGGDANVVETYISYLRKKLDPLGPAADPDGAARRLRACASPSLSLRARLLAVLVSLAAIGLIVAGIATYASLRSFLVERVDRTVTGNARALAHSLDERGRLDPGDLGGLGASNPGVYIGLAAAGSTGALGPDRGASR